MVILASNQVWWTWEVEDVFRKVKKGDKMAMKNYAKKLHSQIDQLVVQVSCKVSPHLKKYKHYPYVHVRRFREYGWPKKHGHPIQCMYLHNILKKK